VRRWILKKCLRHRVIVTLKSGMAFGGILYEQDTEALVLKEASLLEANGTDRVHTPADGAIVILRADVDYVQLP
jgi:small nuclear ribonucleoprotein (snRNP)-like protein